MHFVFAGFKKLFSLVYLDLSHNSIADVSFEMHVICTSMKYILLPIKVKEAEHLSALDCLEQIFLKGNPLTQIDDYRIGVFTLLPNTWKQVNIHIWLFLKINCVYFQLSLDGVEVTAEEQVRLMNLSIQLTCTMLWYVGCSRWSTNGW